MIPPCNFCNASVQKIVHSGLNTLAGCRLDNVGTTAEINRHFSRVITSVKSISTRKMLYSAASSAAPFTFGKICLGLGDPEFLISQSFSCSPAGLMRFNFTLLALHQLSKVACKCQSGSWLIIAVCFPQFCASSTIGKYQIRQAKGRCTLNTHLRPTGKMHSFLENLPGHLHGCTVTQL